MEIIGPRGKTATIILLSGHGIKPSSKYTFTPADYCSFQHSSEMFLFFFFFSGQWLIQRFTTDENAEKM